VSDSLELHPTIEGSGVPRDGHVPSHWRTAKLRQCVRFLGGLTPSMQDRSLWDGAVPWVTPKDMKRSAIGESILTVSTKALEATGLRLIPAGAVLMVVRGMILARRVPIAWTTRPVTVNQDMKGLVPRPGVNARFLALQLEAASEQINPLIDEAGHGTRRLPTERLRDVFVLVPSDEQQASIVRFLGHADRRIRRYIRAKQKLIALLGEQQQAIIHRAVTRGLDPDVRLKPSGVAWLGNVPEHWAIKSVRRLGRVQGGKALAASAPGSQRPYLRVANVFDGRILASQTNTMPFTDAEFERYRLQKGDLLLNEGQSLELVGRTARYVGEPPECAFQNSLIRVQAYEHAEPEFLEFLFRHAQHNEIFAAIATQTTNIAHLGVSRLANLVVALPPIALQRQIVGHLKAVLPEIDTAISRAKRAIELVREYRTRLVADVVTGKLDVREAAAQLPDELDGAEPALDLEDSLEDDGAADIDDVTEEVEA
jgi:type I restriction enzyme S subunit